MSEFDSLQAELIQLIESSQLTSSTTPAQVTRNCQNLSRFIDKCNHSGCDSDTKNLFTSSAKQAIYSLGSASMESAETNPRLTTSQKNELYQAAITAFELIPGYQDATQKASKCKRLKPSSAATTTSSSTSSSTHKSSSSSTYSSSKTGGGTRSVKMILAGLFMMGVWSYGLIEGIADGIFETVAYAIIIIIGFFLFIFGFRKTH